MDWNKTKAPNLGLLVYKQLYREPSIKDKIEYDDDENELEINIAKDAKTTPFDKLYDAIYKKTLENYIQLNNPVANSTFNLFTTYPGLVCGTGYTHDSNAKGDIKIGFYFDHTTGQPIIPGSSIKGVIKSMFENESDTTDQSSVDAICNFFIQNIIVEETGNDKNEWQVIKNALSDINTLNTLKNEIFGSQDKEGTDTFFDAFINIEATSSNSKFIANDFITPHKEALKNPTPLPFLKVLPNVAFQFNFDLKDSTIVPELYASKKELLFKKILLTIGVGAKTNVGYGQFSLKPLDADENQKRETIEEITPWRGQIPSRTDKFITGVIAKVVKKQAGDFFVCFTINEDKYDNFKLTGKPSIDEGKIIKIKVNFKNDKKVNQASFDNAILN